MPDLVIVDGGKGQLSAAVGVMDELGITDVPLSGLAKRFEELYLPGRSAPIVLPRRSQALYLVQRIRDEAHRFAITYHRDVRGKRALHSELDDVEGIGPGRKKALLKRFGSVRRIREATVDEVAATPGHQPRPRRAAEGAPGARGHAGLGSSLLGTLATVSDAGRYNGAARRW